MIGCDFAHMRTPMQDLVDKNICANTGQIGYNARTSVTHSSTIPVSLSRSPSTDPSRSVAEPHGTWELWELIRSPIRRPTLAELYRIAGLFEGEGSFSASLIRMSQRGREVLDRFRQLVGGRVYAVVNRGLKGPTPVFEWYASGPRGRGIARAIYHVLSERRRAQARPFLGISRMQEPPALDPEDPTRLLWDWAPGEDQT